MEKFTLEEAKRQAETIAKRSAAQFALDAPYIQEGLKKMQGPLTFEDARHLYKWLWRKQITLEMIPKDLLDEFKNTSLYEKLISKQL